MEISFYRPPIGEDEAKAVYETVKSGWLTFGKKTEEFEKKFAEYIGAPYCVMTDNCTAALTLACEYVLRNIPRESRYKTVVGVPSLTCAATALAPRYAGASIVFVDLPHTSDLTIGGMSLPGVDYYIPVHFAGKRCDMGKNSDKVLVEDSAHRIIRNGYHGPRQAYSFYVTKCMTTGCEGGMIACEDKEEAEWYRKARLYGNGNAVFEREKMYQTGDQYWWFESEFQGWKATPNDIASTIGLIQLSRLDQFNEERSDIARRYNEAFDLHTDRSPWHLYPILVQDRDKFMYYMKDNGVKCSVHFPPLHMMKAFNKVDGNCPNTEEVYRHIVSLPIFPGMKNEEVEYVIKLVKGWIGDNGKQS